MLTDLVQDPVPETMTPERSENVDADADAPPIVREEKQLLTVVLRKLDAGAPRKSRIQVDDASALIELRDALAEAKPEDQGSILEQMHRIEALSRQRGKGDTPPVDRKSPYFGHLRLEENGKRRDVLVGARSFVEPGGGVQIVDWRNAPVSRLFYRYEEGDAYEERLGDRLVEGEVLARRTVAIVDADLRRVASPQGTFSRDLRTGAWREIAARQARLQIARDGSAAALVPVPNPPSAGAPAASGGLPAPATRGKLGLDENGARRPDRHLPAIAALIDPRQFELITQPASGLIAVQGSAGSGKTTIGLHRIAYLAFADPRRFRPEKMLVIVYQRALASYVSRVLPSLDVPGVPVMTFGNWAETARRAAFPLLDVDLTDETPPVVMRAKAHGAILRILDDRQAALAGWCRDQLVRRAGRQGRRPPSVLAFWRRHHRAHRRARDRAGAVGARHDARPRHAQRRRGMRAARCARARATSSASGRRCSPIARALGAGFARHAPGLFSRASSTTCTAGASSAIACAPARSSGVSDAAKTSPTRSIPRTTRCCCASTSCSAAASLAGQSGATLSYEHLMVDEVQDFSPVELAVLLETTTRAALGDAGGRHRAGDRARARLLELVGAARRSSASRTSASSRCA